MRYAEKLAELLVQRKDITSFVRICSSFEKLKTLPEKNSKKILLIGEEFSYDERRQAEADVRIVLTEGHCRDLGKEEMELKKYQGGDKIAAEILGALMESGGKLRCAESGRARILGVYSPIHRIGKTTFCIKLGKALAEKKNVLYLNLETYAGIGGYFQEEEVQNLSHLLYYVKQDEKDISVRISSIVRQMEKLDYIPPMKVWTDLQEIQIGEWKHVLQCLAEQSIYHEIILDIGNSVKDLFQVLKLCDRLLVPDEKDAYGRAKMKQYHEILQTAGYQELEMRSVYIDMKQPMRQAVKEALKELDRLAGRECGNGSGRTAS